MKKEQYLSKNNNNSADVEALNSRKRQRDDDVEGDVEWEETPTAGISYKIILHL